MSLRAKHPYVIATPQTAGEAIPLLYSERLSRSTYSYSLALGLPARSLAAAKADGLRSFLSYCPPYSSFPWSVLSDPQCLVARNDVGIIVKTMSRFPSLIQNLINAFTKFPGTGPKTATRFVFYLLSRPKEELENLAQSIILLKEKITRCTACQNFSLGSLCEICSDPKRDKSLICIVARPQDSEAIEKTSEYSGIYHILGGVISPLQGIGPEQLKIKELIRRVKQDNIKEIILALNPDMDGETTALYLTKLLKPYNIKITRLARGLPVGSELEYADEVTLSSALKGRKEV